MQCEAPLVVSLAASCLRSWYPAIRERSIWCDLTSYGAENIFFWLVHLSC